MMILKLIMILAEEMYLSFGYMICSTVTAKEHLEVFLHCSLSNCFGVMCYLDSTFCLIPLRFFPVLFRIILHILFIGFFFGQRS